MIIIPTEIISKQKTPYSQPEKKNRKLMNICGLPMDYTHNVPLFCRRNSIRLAVC